MTATATTALRILGLSVVSVDISSRVIVRKEAGATIVNKRNKKACCGIATRFFGDRIRSSRKLRNHVRLNFLPLQTKKKQDK